MNIHGRSIWSSFLLQTSMNPHYLLLVQPVHLHPPQGLISMCCNLQINTRHLQTCGAIKPIILCQTTIIVPNWWHDKNIALHVIADGSNTQNRKVEKAILPHCFRLLEPAISEIEVSKQQLDVDNCVLKWYQMADLIIHNIRLTGAARVETKRHMKRTSCFILTVSVEKPV